MFAIPYRNKGVKANPHLSQSGKKTTTLYAIINITHANILIVHLCPTLSIRIPRNGENIEYIKNGIGIYEPASPGVNLYFAIKIYSAN